MKRAQSLSDASAPGPKKRSVAYAVYQKWKTDMDWECLTVTWLDCDTELSGRKLFTMLRCGVCAEFKTRIATSSEQWLLGDKSVRTSHIRNRAQADQHIYPMQVTAYIAAVGASMHTHDIVKCLYTRPVCHPCMYNKHIVQAIWKSGQSNLILV